MPNGDLCMCGREEDFAKVTERLGAVDFEYADMMALEEAWRLSAMKRELSYGVKTLFRQPMSVSFYSIFCGHFFVCSSGNDVCMQIFIEKCSVRR